MLQKALTKDLTVFILCKGGTPAPALRKTLVGLDRQHYRNFDLVVIDRGMEEEELGAALEHGAHIIELKGRNWKTGAVMNHACEMAGPFILFLSPGAVLQGERWLDTFMKNIIRNDAASLFVRPDMPLYEKRYKREFFNRYRKSYFSGFTAGIRKKTFLYDRFEGDLEYFYDYFWQKTMTGKNRPPYESPDMKVFSEFSHDPGSFYRYKKEEYMEYCRLLPSPLPAGRAAVWPYLKRAGTFSAEMLRFAFKGVLNPFDLIALSPYVFIEEVLFKKDIRLL